MHTAADYSGPHRFGHHRRRSRTMRVFWPAVVGRGRLLGLCKLGVTGSIPVRSTRGKPSWPPTAG